jgi:hypothetical protein
VEICRAITRSGKQCRNNALSGSDYCHIKSHKPSVEPKWCKKTRYFIQNHKILGISIASLFFAIAFILAFVNDASDFLSLFRKDPVLENQKTMIQNQGEMKKILLDQFVANRDNLKKKYPLGFALFYIDSKEIYAPNDVSELKDIRLSWDKSKILEFSENEIVILCPDIIINSRKMNIDVSIGFPRTLGEHAACYNINNIIETKVEVLVNEKDYIVIAHR